MKTLKLIAAMGLGILVSACGNVPDIASRNAPFEAVPPMPYQQSSAADAAVPRAFLVQQVNINVPRSLNVTEANVYYPRADIVWRGDPIGDRHQQIKSIFEVAAFNGTKDMVGERAVVVDMEIQRFHSLSERTRATVGGVHNMHFRMTVRDAATGVPVGPSRDVEANLPAYGGNEAIQAERRGQTQKVRVTGYLAQVIRQELERPQVVLEAEEPAERLNSNI
jgi:hypothetical protein